MGHVKIKIEDHSGAVKEELKRRIQKALEECGQQAERFAVALAPVREKHGGTLRNSITHKVTDNECYIGTNVEYAPYVELGTGIYYEDGGRQTP